ncbi:BrnT family toxin [Arabiibacter massiliensis]|uniref:BrnT family toxin n=1 Tax=Arabiibacter massiliensis TaxID=1870985 RepID=UPI0009B9809E|nr:BrnT family toxin [Arabiibacter massiliensis]
MSIYFIPNGDILHFEYDPAKSARNRAKHGIDFEDAKELWADENLVELSSPYSLEPRFLVLGIMGGKHWTAIVTYRGQTARIISVRRSREKEVAYYDEANQR